MNASESVMVAIQSTALFNFLTSNQVVEIVPKCIARTVRCVFTFKWNITINFDHLRRLKISFCLCSSFNRTYENKNRFVCGYAYLFMFFIYFFFFAAQNDKNFTFFCRWYCVDACLRCCCMCSFSSILLAKQANVFVFITSHKKGCCFLSSLNQSEIWMFIFNVLISFVHFFYHIISSLHFPIHVRLCVRTGHTIERFKFTH